MPTITISQSSDPKVRPARKTWREAGTRPKSKVLAHPRVVMRILPKNRETRPNAAARKAMAAS